MRNRHQIDEPADVREQKKILSAREEELRDQIGKAAVEECCKTVPSTTVRLVKREIYGEVA
jgi:hypothetical protein